MLCHCFHFAYLPEAAARFPLAPATIARLLRDRARHHRSDFASHYGATRDPAAPGEGLVWNLWLDKSRRYDSAADLPPGAALQMQQLVGRLERVAGAPFINKNLRHDARIGALAEVFPEARFLVVVRSPRAIARSLLRGRAERADGLDAWFSIEPTTLASLRDREPIEQVTGQIHGLMGDLRRDLDRVGPHRFAALAYEPLCADPTAAMAAFAEFASSADLSLRTRVPAPPPFPARTDVAPPPTGIDPDVLESHLATAFPDPAAAVALSCRWLTEPPPASESPD